MPCGNGVQRAQEILQRHVLLPALDGAVAAAVAAVQVATRRALPEQIVQFVDADLVVAEHPEEEWIHGRWRYIYKITLFLCKNHRGRGFI